MKQALVIIDVQKDYFPGGRCELFETEKAAVNVKMLLDSFRKRNEPVYFIRHISGKGAGFFEEGTSGTEIYEGIKPLAQEIVITKHYPDSFLDTTLSEELQKKEITDLVICGMMTHMCVDTTVRSAKAKGYTVTLIEDACTTMNLKRENQVVAAKIVQEVYMASLDSVFATVMKLEEYLKMTE